MKKPLLHCLMITLRLNSYVITQMCMKKRVILNAAGEVQPHFAHYLLLAAPGVKGDLGCDSLTAESSSPSEGCTGRRLSTAWMDVDPWVKWAG